MVITSAHQLDERISQIREASDKTLKALRTLLATPEHDSLEILRRLKFTTVGHDFEGAPMNLIEQINVTFTDLVTMQAARWLFLRHPEAQSLRVSLGSKPDIDIESHPNGLIAAEAFAAVRPNNNRKLAKDLAKLAGVNSTYRYVFFCCPSHSELSRQTRLETVQGVEVWSLPSEYVMKVSA